MHFIEMQLYLERIFRRVSINQHSTATRPTKNETMYPCVSLWLVTSFGLNCRRSLVGSQPSHPHKLLSVQLYTMTLRTKRPACVHMFGRSRAVGPQNETRRARRGKEGVSPTA